MKKSLLKISALAVCLIVAVSALTACGGEPAKLGLAHVDVYTYVGNTLSPKLTTSGSNRVSFDGDLLTVNVAANVTEVEFDLAPFFAANTAHKGKDFYFTRSDVKKGDGTLVKGKAWYQTGGDAGNRLYKPLGYENDETVTAKNKEAIAALPNREGEVRMYIITSGTQTGKHVVYLDPTTGSEVETGETRVNFMFNGHNGKKAQLKVLVIKAAE